MKQRNTAGYVEALIFSMLFLTYINGQIGRALSAVIMVAMALSVISAAISAKHFSVKLSELTGVSEVNRNVDFEVELKKTGFCFIPYIELCIETEGQSIRIRTALLFKGSVTIKGSFIPSHSGLNELCLQNALLGDFLGNVRKIVPLDQKQSMAVLPRIIEYDGPEVIPNSLPSEEEEVEEGATVQHGGLPGYEHRDYSPGDSIRRINYKLSAKKRKLMVRLDESAGTASTNLFIADNAHPICCDKAFALAQRLVFRGGTVKIYHKGADRSAASPETLNLLREWLAFREFANGSEQPPFSPPPEGTSVVFSGNGDVVVGH